MRPNRFSIDQIIKIIEKQTCLITTGADIRGVSKKGCVPPISLINFVSFLGCISLFFLNGSVIASILFVPASLS